MDLILEVSFLLYCTLLWCTLLYSIVLYTTLLYPAVLCTLLVVLQEDFDSEQMSALASCLAELFKDHFRGDVLPEEITEE